MKKFMNVIAIVGLLGAISAPAFSQDATPLFDDMAEKNYGEKGSLERYETCLLAIKTYDYGVKELGLAKADSKQAVRADKALPFVTLGLETKTQTPLLFNRSLAKVKSEFAVFKAADSKAQKNLFKIAKGPNKTCAKPYDDRKLEGYGRLDKTSDYLADVGSEEALLCASVAVKGLSMDRASFMTGFVQYLSWEKTYQNALRREGHPDDQIIEALKIKEVEKKVQDIDESRALELYETCPTKFKKAKFQADLKKDEPAAVPVVDWN